jgi:hypothetical protein
MKQSKARAKRGNSFYKTLSDKSRVMTIIAGVLVVGLISIVGYKQAGTSHAFGTCTSIPCAHVFVSDLLLHKTAWLDSNNNVIGKLGSKGDYQANWQCAGGNVTISGETTNWWVYDKARGGFFTEWYVDYSIDFNNGTHTYYRSLKYGTQGIAYRSSCTP